MQCAFYAIKNDSTFVIEKEERPRTFFKKKLFSTKTMKTIQFASAAAARFSSGDDQCVTKPLIWNR